MSKPEEVELFSFLHRQTAFRKWLTDRIEAETQVLIQAVDIDQLRRAQGRASAWQTMLTQMEQCAAADKRK